MGCRREWRERGASRRCDGRGGMRRRGRGRRARGGDRVVFVAPGAECGGLSAPQGTVRLFRAPVEMTILWERMDLLVEMRVFPRPLWLAVSGRSLVEVVIP